MDSAIIASGGFPDIVAGCATGVLGSPGVVSETMSGKTSGPVSKSTGVVTGKVDSALSLLSLIQLAKESRKGLAYLGAITSPRGQ
jgi:hypothetical protein